LPVSRWHEGNGIMKPAHGGRIGGVCAGALRIARTFYNFKITLPGDDRAYRERDASVFPTFHVEEPIVSFRATAILRECVVRTAATL
jgi:hypothetical protein